MSNRYVLVLRGFTQCLSTDLLPKADRHVPSGFALRCEYSIHGNSEYYDDSRKLLKIHIFCHKVPKYKCLPAFRKTVIPASSGWTGHPRWLEMPLKKRCELLRYCIISKYYRKCRHSKQDRPCAYNVTLGRVRATTVVVGKHYILWVCVFSLRYPACNAHALYCHLWSTRL